MCVGYEKFAVLTKVMVYFRNSTRQVHTVTSTADYFFSNTILHMYYLVHLIFVVMLCF